MSRHSDDALVAALCRQSADLLERLGISGALTMTRLHERLEQQRGRPIHLIPHALPPSAPHGLWVAGEHSDYIFFDRAAPPARQHQIIAHEYGHMVFDDEGTSADLGELATLINDADAVVSSQACQRTMYDELREQRAELFGTVVVGSTVRAWQPRPRLGGVTSWVRSWRVARQLHPLWMAIRSVLPEISVLPRYTGVSAWKSAVRQANLRWVRQPIEILDGYALLAPWMSVSTATVAEEHARRARLRGDDIAATVEAAVLASALRARQRQEPPAPDPVPLTISQPSTLADQIAWLLRVDRARRRSPVVGAILAALDTSAPP